MCEDISTTADDATSGTQAPSRTTHRELRSKVKGELGKTCESLIEDSMSSKYRPLAPSALLFEAVITYKREKGREESISPF